MQGSFVAPSVMMGSFITSWFLLVRSLRLMRVSAGQKGGRGLLLRSHAMPHRGPSG